MKKSLLYISLLIFVNSCKSYTYEIKDYENDSYEHVKKKTLKFYKAENNKYSLLIFTTEYLGSKFIIKNYDTIIFNDSIKTNKMISYATTIRIDNTRDTKIKDLEGNQSVKIKSELAKTNKYIYIRKMKYLKDEIGNDSLVNGKKILNKNKFYLLTYSNTLLGTM